MPKAITKQKPKALSPVAASRQRVGQVLKGAKPGTANRAVAWVIISETPAKQILAMMDEAGPSPDDRKIALAMVETWRADRADQQRKAKKTSSSNPLLAIVDTLSPLTR